MPSINLSYPALQVKNFDNDHYLCSLFATNHIERENLLTLYAFNLEINRISSATTEPMMGLIRLQWWLDIIEDIYKGKIKDHPIIKPLSGLITEFNLPKTHFLQIISAKEHEMEPKPLQDLTDLYTNINNSSLPVMQLALHILGISPTEIIEVSAELAKAWGILHIIRASKATNHKIIPTTRELALLAEDHLDKVYQRRNQIPIKALPIFLQATIARVFLKRIRKYNYDVINHDIERSRTALHISLLCKALLRRF